MYDELMILRIYDGKKLQFADYNGPVFFIFKADIISFIRRMSFISHGNKNLPLNFGDCFNSVLRQS